MIVQAVDSVRVASAHSAETRPHVLLAIQRLRDARTDLKSAKVPWSQRKTDRVIDLQKALAKAKLDPAVDDLPAAFKATEGLRLIAVPPNKKEEEAAALKAEEEQISKKEEEAVALKAEEEEIRKKEDEAAAVKAEGEKIRKKR